jgi:hypothetical protein
LDYLEYVPPVLAVIAVVIRLTMMRPRARADKTKKK